MTDNAALDAMALENDARQGERAFRKLYDFLARFISYPSEHAHLAHALWCIYTHLMDRWESTPRLAFCRQNQVQERAEPWKSVRCWCRTR